MHVHTAFLVFRIPYRLSVLHVMPPCTSMHVHTEFLVFRIPYRLSVLHVMPPCTEMHVHTESSERSASSLGDEGRLSVSSGSTSSTRLWSKAARHVSARLQQVLRTTPCPESARCRAAAGEVHGVQRGWVTPHW